MEQRHPLRRSSLLLLACSVFAFLCGSFVTLVSARPTAAHAETRVEYRFVDTDDSEGRKRELERLAESGWIAKSLAFDPTEKERVLVLMEKIYQR